MSKHDSPLRRITDMGDILTHNALLEGVKVLGFAHVLAGPTCTRILTELGAEVMKLEVAPSGDVARGVFHDKENLSALFLYTCAGKKSLCLDVKRPDWSSAPDIVRLTQEGIVIKEARVKELREKGLIR